MAFHQQQANPKFPFGIGAGWIYGGVPPISDQQAKAAALQCQAMGNIIEFQSPLQPQPPDVSGPGGFQQNWPHDEDCRTNDDVFPTSVSNDINERSKNIKSMRNDLLCYVELPWSCGFLIVWFYDVVFCDSVVVLFVIMWFCDYNNCDWIII